MPSTERAFEEEVIEFAKQHDSILGISRGGDPEEGNGIYYFLIRGKHRFELDDPITELDLRLSRETGLNYTFFQWPASPDRIGDNSFLGELIYSR